MAEPESILQLGIEAAREGNKEEARSLFRLLTRQEPQNAQAWLWLAGVAENRDERQAALERVVELDPGNEMAQKGLQALGARPTNRHIPVEPEVPVAPVEPLLPTLEPPPVATPASARDRYDVDDDDPFAALDTLSEAMNEAPAAVRRTESSSYKDDDGDERAGALAAASAASSRESRPSFSSSRDRRSETSRSAARPRRVNLDDDEDDTEPARRGMNPLLIALIGLALLALLVIFVWPFVFPEESVNVATNAGTQQTAAAETRVAATQESRPAATSPAQGAVTGVQPGTQPGAQPTAEGGAQPGAQPTAEGGEQPTAEGGAQPTAEGQAPAAPAAPADVSQANPAVVAANTPLESNGWLYDFNQPTYASPVIGNLGGFQPQGRFVVVLVFAENRTGQNQSIPPDFFVLKDAQGRVYEARPDVSAAYVIPGVNADLNQQQALPADGLTRSVAVIFDVAPDATDLVFFARSNPAQGWLILQRV